jgi:hypothetical protein
LRRFLQKAAAFSLKSRIANMKKAALCGAAFSF